MIYRTSQEEVGFDTKEDYLEINRVRDDLKKRTKGDNELFKKLLGEYFYSLPMKK